MLVLVGDHNEWFEGLKDAMAQANLDVHPMRFNDRVPFGDPTTFVVDLGGAVGEALRERLLYTEHLSKFRAEVPLFTLVDRIGAQHQRQLLRAHSAGIFARRWGHRLLVTSVEQHLENIGTHPKQRRLPAPHPADHATILRQLRPHTTDRQLRLAATLMENEGRVMTREELLTSVWETTDQAEIRMVDYGVFRLRNRMREALGIDGVVRTVKNRGYVFHAPDGGRAAATVRDIDPTTRQLVLIEEDETRARHLLRAAEQEKLNLTRWSLGDPSLPHVDLAFLVAGATPGWFDALRAFALHHPGTGVLVSDHGAEPALLARAAKLPRACLCSLASPFTTFPTWLPWALQRIDFHGPQAPIPFALVPESQAVRLQGVPYPLPPKDYGVLALLHNFVERPVTRERIQAQVWNGRLPGHSRSLDMRVSKLRALLRKHFGAGPPCIETLAGLGYRLRLQ